MTRISTQSALQALRVMHEAKDIRVTASGKVRPATIFDKAASRLHQWIYSTKAPSDWEKKAKEEILIKFNSEISLLNKNFSDKDKEKLKNIIFNVNVKKENSTLETWRNTFVAEAQYLIKDKDSTDLAKSLSILEKIDRIYPSKIDQYIKVYLNEDNSIAVNAELQGISKYLQAEKKLSESDALEASRKVINSMNRYGISFERAIKIFALPPVTINPTIGSESKGKINETDDSRNKNLINDLSIYLEKNYSLPKDLATSSAKKIDRIMARYGMDIPHALEFSNFVGKMAKLKLLGENTTFGKNTTISEADLDTAKVVQHVMKRDDVSINYALEVANRRSAALPMLEAALPQHFKLNIVDDVISGFSTQLSSDVAERLKENISTLSKLDVKDYVLSEKKYQLCDAYLKDTVRDFNCTFNNKSTFSHFEKSNQQAMTTELIKITGNVIAAKSLSKIINQALVGALMTSVLTDDAKPKQGGLLMLGPKGDSEFKTKLTKFYVSKIDDNKITVRVVHFESNGSIEDGLDSNKNWAINSGNIWNKDIDETNFGSMYDMTLDLQISDLNNEIINPNIRQSNYRFRISPNWDEIDTILAVKAVRV
jgi:hypothetical protein